MISLGWKHGRTYHSTAAHCFQVKHRDEHGNSTNFGIKDSYQSNSLVADVSLISDLECFVLFVTQVLVGVRVSVEFRKLFLLKLDNKL